MEHFADNQSTDNVNNFDPSLVKNPSNFNPPTHRDLVLDTYVDYLTKYPLEEISENQGRHKFNLNKEEWNAIIQLKNDNSLVIKEGDKGGACVIMESDYYKDKMMLLLVCCILFFQVVWTDQLNRFYNQCYINSMCNSIY